MTLPSDFAFTLPPSFSSFHSEDALIQIQPTHRLGHLHLVSKSYGPLEPAQVCEVPLWCAVSLKKGGRCKIVCPSWMERRACLDRFTASCHCFIQSLEYLELAIIKIPKDKPLAMETDLSLSSDALQDSVRLEKEQGAFASLNFYWIEISQTLLS